MSPDHTADNEHEELYVEDLNLGDISGAGLSGLFAKSEGADDLPPGIEPEEDEEVPVEFELAPEPVEDEPAPEAPKSKGRRGGLLGRLGDLKDSFAEELEKAKAEEDDTTSPAVEEAPPVPLEVPELDDEAEPAPLTIPDAAPAPPPTEPPPAAAAPLPAFDDDEELVYEEPAEEETPEIAPPPTAPQVAETMPSMPSEPAPLLFDDGDEDDQPEADGGFLGMLRQRWAMAQESKKASNKKIGPEGAGVDISPPGDSSISSILGRLTGHGAKAVPVAASAAADESGFAALLKPLPAGEIAMLQAELANDETVFARIDRQRRDMANRQLFGFLIGLACLIFFGISDGHHYLVDVLNHAAQPSWIPDSVRGDTAGAALYALGLLVPLASLFIIADGVRYLMSAAVMRRVDDLLLGMVAGVCSLGAIYSCSDGQVISGVLLVAAYGVVQLAARLLGVNKS